MAAAAEATVTGQPLAAATVETFVTRQPLIAAAAKSTECLN
jgi:hypothetical protein